MKLELDSIQKSKTWKLIDFPKGKNLISAKWVFKVNPTLIENLKNLKLALLPANVNNMKA
jgi:hypothetical protein